MGFEDEDQYSYSVGLKVMLAGTFSLFAIVLFIIIFFHFYARYLLRHRQRRRNQDVLYQVRTQITPIDVAGFFPDSPNSGLNPSIIASLPIILYKQYSDQLSQGEGMECSICLSTIVEDAHIRVLPNCKHIFHVECIDVWFGSNVTCPVCRTGAEPRMQPDGHLSTQLVQPTVPPPNDGSDADELEKVGGSGLRIASFRTIFGRERSPRRNQNSDGLALEDIERH